MTRLIKTSTRPVGLPPGSLFHTGKTTVEKIHFSIMDYNENEVEEQDQVSVLTCQAHLASPTMTWVQVYGVSDPSIISSVGQHFNLHPLVIEDILNTGQRSKLDTYEDQVFIVVRFLQYDDHTQELKDEQVSIVFGHNYLVCFLERDKDIFQAVKERIRQDHSRIRKFGADYLAYALLDTIVDYYFVVLEKVDIQLDQLEEELLHYPKSTTLPSIQKAKREMIVLRKAIWPMRDVVNRFQHLESTLINPSTQIYLRDIYDHIVQTIDVIEGFRDVVSGMLDIYLSNINIRTNDIMKVLTIVSTIFVPLTFISSLYGMNFDYMPELHHRWGYPLALGTMAFMAISMLLYFHHKKWI